MLTDSLKEKIEKVLSPAIREGLGGDLGLEKIDFQVSFTTNPAFGDLTANTALVAFPKLKDKFKSPRELAEKIAEEIKKDKDFEANFSQVKVEGPGFINFWFSKNALTEFANQVLQDPKKIIEPSKEKKKIMVEFGHPNTHKQMHLGHLRTLLIGESLARIFSATGNEVFRANYQGDIGPHVAKAIYGVQKLLKEKNLTLSDIAQKPVLERGKFLQNAYIIGNRDYEEHKNEIDEINNKLYKKDPEIWEVYQITRTWSLEYFNEFYKIFSVKYDKLFFESEVAECGKQIVLENVGKVFEKDESTIVFPGEKYGLHNRVFVTRDGNPTYEGKEMCLAQKQFETFPFDLAIHVVASEQKGYFQVVFKALELIDPKFKNRELHLSMGMVNLSTGKMSSRTGEIVTVDGLIEMVRKAVTKLVSEGRLAEGEKSETIEKITRAAVAYAYLRVTPTQNLVFDISKSISLDGDSGPYLLYTYVRTQSVLRKAEGASYQFQIPSFQLNKEEEELLRFLTQFPETVERAKESLSPNIIANYLFELAQKFNLFYEKHKILQDEKTKGFRLALTASVGKILKSGLDLLCITAPERM
ncbi:arginine--tRNA ligase [Patescibacteria group bacterium]|nr:arginine--tRNA ligase [Patescibacteria group bacterium]